MNQQKTNSSRGGGNIPVQPHLEYSRILTAAVVNARFRQVLLSNPAMAIASGYAGEKFHLEKEERKHLISIRASNLSDFASQLSRRPGAM